MGIVHLISFIMGIVHLGLAIILGFSGLIYLILFISDLSTGKIEIDPTEVTIRQLEENGFPKAQYLKIMDAYFVFSEAALTERNKDKDLGYLSVPIVSQSLLEKWQTSSEQNKYLDASEFRLYVIFTGLQVKKLWPGNKNLENKNIKFFQIKNQTPILGELGEAKWSLTNKPMDSSLLKKNLNWEKIHYLKFEKHTFSLERSIKFFSYALLLLAISTFLIILYRKIKYKEIVIPYFLLNSGD